MSFRSSEEFLPASEDSFFYCQPGSVVLSKLSEVDNWCQSVPLVQGFPPTPPDTASDCSLSDCPDMDRSSWNFVPEESWSSAPPSEYSAWMNMSNADGPNPGFALSQGGLPALDVSSWLNVPQGPVDSGLSPVLSQESQNSHAFLAASESDTPSLPPGLDLSFISEPTWELPGSVMYPSPYVHEDYSTRPETLHTLPIGPMHSEYPYQVSNLYNPQHPALLPHGGQAPSPRKVAMDTPLSPRRPILPRTDGHVPQSQVHHGYRAAQILTPAERTDAESCVSNVQGRLPESVVSGRSSSRGSTGQPCHLSPKGPTPTPRVDAPLVTRTFTPPGGPNDAQIFTRTEIEGRVSPRVTSYTGEAPNIVNAQSIPGPVRMEHVDSVRSESRLSSSNSIASEGDEGRHRNHPLYSKGPQSDGLYHCPFAKDPQCQHKPTKLKCNYDKFVDSHLKPFRCKAEACSKQEFSSTACLLRHEREAHGMHGHGDRPHLCYYTGCERGAHGNGFPRRYNLFDHMKRVHDHKEEPSPAVDVSEFAGTRKAGGRKRKAPSSVSEEPPARRTKLQQVQQPSPTLSLPLNVPASHVPTYLELDSSALQGERFSQQALYPQWPTQADLLEFQMNYAGHNSR